MKYNLALVEYLNTFPFSEGLRSGPFADQLTIFKVTPAQCAQLFKQGTADISLCPIGALEDMPPHEVRGEYCIGADGLVGTVVLLSKVPVDEIKTVRFDHHSRTSNLLLQILAQRLWNKEWAYTFESTEELPESCLMIGDKVFTHREHYPFQYDLGAAWKTLTGLPMVFAVWITRPGIPDQIIQRLDDAFRVGWAHIKSGQSGLASWQTDYLLHNISYPLDAAKKEAMELFVHWAATIKAEPVNP